MNRRIGAQHHVLYTIETRKRGLCAFDDKRYLLADGIHSLAFGHRDIPHPIEDIEPIAPAPIALDDRQAIRLGVANGNDAFRLLPANQPGREPRDLYSERDDLLRHIRQERERRISFDSDDLNSDEDEVNNGLLDPM